MYRRVIKHSLDLLIATIAFILLLPVFLIVLLLLIIFVGNPFFIQDRPGKNGVIFKIIKFRTMTNARNANGELLPDEKRLIGVGKIVRRLSLDEIPQLLNVIKGDMSLVGPRPLLVEYLPLYSDVQKKRHDVRPGITGWAQVNGRNAISWPEKFKLDVWYVDNMSFRLDLKIIAMTILKVFRPKGISSATSATMEKFKGNVLI